MNEPTKVKQKDYRIFRTVKEVFYVQAISRENAVDILATEGRTPVEITVVKETVRHIK